MADRDLDGRQTGKGKQRSIDYQALAQSFVKWECEKLLSIYNVSSRWGRVCEDVNWPNTKKSRLHLRTIWTTNRGNIRNLIIKESQSQTNPAADLRNGDHSMTVTNQHSQLKRKLRINPKRKRFSIYEEPKSKKVRYCLCKSTFSTLQSAHMLQCFYCKEWYHTNKCLGLGTLLEHVPGKTIKYQCGLLGCQAEPMLVINKVDKTNLLKKAIGNNNLSDTNQVKPDNATADKKDTMQRDLQDSSQSPDYPNNSFDSHADRPDTPSSANSFEASSNFSYEGKRPPSYSASTPSPTFPSAPLFSRSPLSLPSTESDENDDNLRKVPQQFSITLSAEDWSSIKPQTGVYHLTKQWSDKLREACKKENPYCVLVFKQNHIRSGTYKINAPYFHGRAVCKFKGCATYHFRTKTDPKPGTDVLINVIREGDLKHMKGMLINKNN